MSRIHTPSSLVLVGLLLAACGDNSTAQPSVVSDSATPTTQPIQPSDASTTELSADETQTVRLTDFAIEMPEVVAGPFIDIELVNDGTLAHEVAFARIEPGTTAEQVLDALAGGGESSAFLLGDPGGINLIGPGGCR